MSSRLPLPIDPALPEICEKLAASGALVLQAEPGAGKTTRVPPALLAAGLAGPGSILVLEPRRVAARAAADYVASERGEAVGESVGFQVRFDRCGGRDTRIWFVTEGIAMRRLVSDPFLEDVGVVLLDEFHERHLAGDVLLAIARELRRTVRSDLKIVVMSATLDVERIAAFLDDCPVVRCPGRAYPVAVEYRAAARDRRLADEVVAAIRGIGGDEAQGDVLVFLPGAAEIRRCERALLDAGLDRGFRILPLHGDLPLDAQRRVLRGGGERRIVLSTNVAESSVTVDGVTAVVDSGLARMVEVDAARGVERLRVMPISIASADQRAGRAGRQRAGRCVRLWSEHEHAARRPRETPEIRRLDLASTVLELRAWGLHDPHSLAWLDPPPPGALEAAQRLLRDLGAIAPDGNLSDVGRRMLRLAVPVRAARMTIEVARRGYPAEAALAGALLAEREIALGARAFGERGAAGRGRSDLIERIELFEAARSAGFERSTCRSLGVDAAAARAVDRASNQLLRALQAPRGAPSRDSGEAVSATCEEALLRGALVAFSDRLVRRRASDGGRGVMVGGSGVRLADHSCVRDDELLVAIELRSGDRRQRTEALVAMASAVERGWLDDCFAAEIEHERRLVYDDAGERVVTVESESFRGLVLSEKRAATSGGAGAGMLLERALADPATAVELSPRGQALLQRIDFLVDSGLESVEGGSTGLLRTAITLHGAGVDSLGQLRRRLGDAAIEAALTFEQKRELERLAPSTFRLPSGRVVPIEYDRVGGPAISARIQELFGLRDSPRVAAGRVAVAVEMLGPNYRPVQTTRDLASFWNNTYPDIRKELRGRYPKHDWPEDPWTAQASSRVGRRRGR
jgi:ATP-dependent helicase HrpB